MAKMRVDDEARASAEMVDDAKRILREHLVRLGLKQSSQRDVILRTFLASREHLSTEEPSAIPPSIAR
jgi:hypothetical protein